MHGFSRGGIPIHLRNEDKGAAFLAGSEETFRFENAHQSENSGISVLALQSLDHVCDRGRTPGPDDFHNAMFGVGERSGLLLHAAILSIKALVDRKIAAV